MTTMTNGLLYITYGKKYVLAAMYSAKTARKHNPGISIHLFVDQTQYDAFNFASDPTPFTSVDVIENPHRRSKVDCMSKTPFDRTLYLDSDTSVAQDISSIFDVLERFDIAAVQAMHRNSKSGRNYWRIKIPDAFPQFNSGVLLYRKNEEVLKLFSDWSSAFSESGSRHDQPSLRELIWLSGLRSYALPPEYNVRYLKYKYIWNKTEAVPMIYHLKQYHEGWAKWTATKTLQFLIGTVLFITRPLRKLLGIKKPKTRSEMKPGKSNK